MALFGGKQAFLPHDVYGVVRHIAKKSELTESDALIAALNLTKKVVDGELIVAPKPDPSVDPEPHKIAAE